MTTTHEPPATSAERILAPDKAGINGSADSAKLRKPRETAVLAAAFALGCLACLIPGLLAGGALAATFGALGADEIVFGALAVVLAIAAVAVFLVRRSRRAAATSDGCGC